MLDDSSAVVSPRDEMRKVMLDVPNVDDVSNARVSVAEASVSNPEDVCYRIKKNRSAMRTCVTYECTGNM